MIKDHSQKKPTGYSIHLAARDILYAPSDRQDSTYQSFCYVIPVVEHWLERYILTDTQTYFNHRNPLIFLNKYKSVVLDIHN